MTAAQHLLAELIACDTQNPPRDIGVDHRVFQVVSAGLGRSFDLQFVDHGRGRVALLASRGRPDILFNVHLDTVPAGDGWSQNPLEMHLADGRAIGRGVCDNKGAAAALITAAASTDQPVALLFTTDEEGTENVCVRHFCASGAGQPFRQIVVAEPTGCQAVTTHRGYLSVTGEFSGVAGHTSRFDDLPASANHRAIRWAARALELVQSFEQSRLAGQSVCLNIGRLDGGTKNNMIARSCRLTWSMRPPPGASMGQLMELVTGDAGDQVQWDISFLGDPLPAADNRHLTQQAEAFCRQRGVPLAEPVDFWTEASVFSAAGFPAVLLGPGDIGQAHTVDEWLAIDQLASAVTVYQSLMQPA